MSTIWGGIYTRIKGGWKTVNASGVGAFDYGGMVPTSVGPIPALKLSAYYACLRLISETMGTFSFQLYDNANKVIADHDLYGIMAQPNQSQSGDMFVSGITANMQMFGNGMAHIKRMPVTGRAYGLDFYNTELWNVESDEQGRPKFSINGEEVPSEDVLHFAGFGLSGYWGLPTLLVGGDVLSMQAQSNNSASQMFQNGLRTGGFFTLPESRQAFTNEQLKKFNEELTKMAQPGNTGRWLPLLPGMGAIANQSFRIDPVTAELLQSRYFGIEEICRYMGVPPPLIGHTDKASSWASSTDALNQFLVTYCMLPKARRLEAQIRMKLLGRNERNKYKPTYNMDALLRADIEKRFKTYQIGRQENIYSINDCRAKENLPAIEGGDDYTASGTHNTGGTPNA